MPRKRRSNPKTMRQAAELRRVQTPAEEKLWSRLRGHRLEGVGFRRQHAIGSFIVDFCAPSRKLIIEIDGGQHREQKEYDAERTAYLESLGYKMLRFFNSEVTDNIEAVLQIIYDEINKSGEM